VARKDVGSPFEPGPAQPRLNQYGVPVTVRPPAKVATYLFGAFCCVVTVLVAAAYVIFFTEGGQAWYLPVALARHQPALRVFMDVTGVLGIAPTILLVSLRKRVKFRWGPAADNIGPWLLGLSLLGGIFLLLMSGSPGRGSSGY
jgi:hypothetical protein